MGRIYVFFATGYEEVEALSVVDILRRAKHDVQMVSCTDSIRVVSSHGIEITMNGMFDEYSYSDADILVLPGGMPGMTNLMAHEGLKEALHRQYEAGKLLGAICAAPTVFAVNGFLKGRRATAYPSFMERLTDADAVTDSVVVDGNVITSRGLGTALDFALKITEILDGKETAERIAESIVKLK